MENFSGAALTTPECAYAIALAGCCETLRQSKWAAICCQHPAWKLASFL